MTLVICIICRIKRSFQKISKPSWSISSEIKLRQIHIDWDRPHLLGAYSTYIQELELNPEDICWESRDDVERLTNKQLQLYLRQESLMVSGNKAQLVERILKHGGWFYSNNLVPRAFSLAFPAPPQAREKALGTRLL